MNNTTTCIISPEIMQMREITFFLTYYIFSPIYMISDTFGNAILLYAFYKEAKTESGYVYQFLVAVCSTFELLTFSTVVAGKKWWSGLESAGAVWFKRLYAPMWITAHFASPISNGFLTSYLYLSICMAADRVVAIAFPFKYRNLNHRYYQVLAAVLSFVLGQATSLFDCFRYVVERDGDMYRIGVDSEYVASSLASILSSIRNAVRIIGLISLVVLNVAMCILFKKRTAKASQLTNSKAGQKPKKNADGILLLLTMWQSLVICLMIAPLVCYYIMVYVSPTFTQCWGEVVIPFVDGAMVIPHTMDFIMALVLNKKIRKMLVNMIRCKSNKVSATGTGMPSRSDVRNTAI